MKTRGKLIIGSLLISSAIVLLGAKWPVLMTSTALGETSKLIHGIPLLEKVMTLKHSSAVLGVAWSPDGNRLAAYSQSGGLITIWSSDGQRLKEILRREGIPGYSNYFVFLAGGKVLLTAAAHSSPADSHIAFNLWEIDSGAVIRDVEGPEPDKIMQYNRPVAYAASADGQYVAFTTYQANEPVNLYATRDWSLVRRISVVDPETKRGLATSVAFSPDGTLLGVSLAAFGKVLIVNLKHLEDAPIVLHVYASGYPVGINSLAFSPDGQYLATGSGLRIDSQKVTESHELALEHASVKVWRVTDQNLVASFPGDLSNVKQLSWSPDSRFLAAAMDDSVRLYTPGEPWNNASVSGFGEPVFSVQFSPKGHELAVASGSAVTIFTLGHQI
jgi:WD40 repeat protein